MIYYINKPKGITSFKAVQKLKKKLHIKKAGHTGTLDPAAEGLLIICTDKDTKQIKNFQEMDKTYIAEIELGKTSDTYDNEGKIILIAKHCGLSIEKIKKILKKKFTGNIRQITPAFSSAKIGGETFHSLKRKGKKVPISYRDVTIHKITILRYSWPILKLEIVCSSGTYIRSLAHELGETLKCGAILKSLKRTRIGMCFLRKSKKISNI